MSALQNFITKLAVVLLIPVSVECTPVIFFSLCVLGPKPIHTHAYGECLVQPDVKRCILLILASGPVSVPLAHFPLWLLVMLLAAVTSVQLSSGLVKCCYASLSFRMSDFSDIHRSINNFNFIILFWLIGQSIDLLADPHQGTRPSYRMGSNLIHVSIHCEAVETY